MIDSVGGRNFAKFECYSLVDGVLRWRGVLHPQMLSLGAARGDPTAVGMLDVATETKGAGMDGSAEQQKRRAAEAHSSKAQR